MCPAVAGTAAVVDTDGGWIRCCCCCCDVVVVVDVLVRLRIILAPETAMRDLDRGETGAGGRKEECEAMLVVHLLFGRRQMRKRWITVVAVVFSFVCTVQL